MIPSRCRPDQLLAQLASTCSTSVHQMERRFEPSSLEREQLPPLSEQTFQQLPHVTLQARAASGSTVLKGVRPHLGTWCLQPQFAQLSHQRKASVHLGQRRRQGCIRGAACASPLERSDMASGESLKILRELQSRPENKVSLVPTLAGWYLWRSFGVLTANVALCRCALTATPRTPPGPPYPMAFLCVWSAAASIGAWACTSALSGDCLSLFPALGNAGEAAATSRAYRSRCSGADACTPRIAGRSLWTLGQQNSSSGCSWEATIP